MSVAKAAGTRVEERDREMSTFAEARWLAGREIKRSWLSYPVTALGMLFFGLFAASVVDGFLVFEGFGEGVETIEDWFNALFVDYFFIVWGAVLAINWTSREYFRVFSEDAFSERLVFMRGLPISSATLVLGRLMSMCFSFLLNTPAFFVPVYLISNLDGLGWDFLWFVAVWAGYSLMGTGLSLLAEFTISGKAYVWLSFAWGFLLIVSLMILEWTVDLRLVTRIAGLTEAYGPLPALVALLVGSAVLTVLTRTTIRRVEQRDLYA